jgi:hypothetical protein
VKVGRELANCLPTRLLELGSSGTKPLQRSYSSQELAAIWQHDGANVPQGSFEPLWSLFCVASQAGSPRKSWEAGHPTCSHNCIDKYESHTEQADVENLVDNGGFEDGGSSGRPRLPYFNAAT